MNYLGRCTVKSWMAIAVSLVLTDATSAQWSTYRYEIHRLGLFGPEYTGSAGYQNGHATLYSDAGYVAGGAMRISGVNRTNGEDAWLFDPTNATIERIGLTGAVYTGINAYQSSRGNFLNSLGQVAGVSDRILDQNIINGQDAWFYDSAAGQAVQIGLFEAAYTGSVGYRYSGNKFLGASGHVVGYSVRIANVSANNGENTWVYSDGVTTPTGFTGPAYTGTGGYQYSVNDFVFENGMVGGYSDRLLDAKTSNGRSTWVYNPLIETTMQTGFTGAEYTGSNGYQYSDNDLSNDEGVIAGYSQQIAGVQSSSGQSTWIFSPLTNAIVRTGLVDVPDGSRYSVNNLLNATGYVAGFTSRTVSTGLTFSHYTWIYNPTTNAIIPTGLLDDDHAATDYQQHINNFINDAGQVAGTSARIYIYSSGVSLRACLRSGE